VDPESELYEFADAIALAQKRLATTVDQIRSFAALEPDSSAFEPASLTAVVDEALAILRYDHGFRARKVVRNDRAQPLVALKREQFDQVLINLVSNAVEATESGDTITIEVSEDTKTGMAILTVEDSGQGMSKEVLEHLGEPFFTTRGDRGSGLGVGICMSIARAHGGSIIYVSEVGVGTTAKVRLPLFLGDGSEG
jgi:signal transduction histidine kinase